MTTEPISAAQAHQAAAEADAAAQAASRRAREAHQVAADHAAAEAEQQRRQEREAAARYIAGRFDRAAAATAVIAGAMQAITDAVLAGDVAEAMRRYLELNDAKARANAEYELLKLAYAAVGDQEAIEREQRSGNPWPTGAAAGTFSQLLEEASGQRASIAGLRVMSAGFGSIEPAG